MTIFGKAAVAAGLLALLAAPGIGWAGTDDSARRLTVQCCRGSVSVEARGATLAQVLGEIGARAGFAVVDTAASLVTVELSLRADSVDDLLDQLLRSENYTVLYRDGGGAASDPGIHTIVLLGAAAESRGMAETTADALPPAEDSAEARHSSRAEPVPGESRDRSMASSAEGASATAEPVSASAATPPPAVDQEADRPAAAAAGSPPTVEGLLAAHAIAASMPPGAVVQSVAPAPAPSGVILPAVPAELTLRAQASLGALIGGLTDAMRSMRQPVAGGAK